MSQNGGGQGIERNEVSKLLGVWVLYDIRVNDSLPWEEEVFEFSLSKLKMHGELLEVVREKFESFTQVFLLECSESLDGCLIRNLQELNIPSHRHISR